jgi:hypothetical protein
VKQVTSGRFSLRQECQERVGHVGVDKGWFGARTPAMGQQLQTKQLKGWQLKTRQSKAWRSGSGQNLWLSMLVDAMEKFSRPELRAVPCDQLVLAAARAHLARPACTYLPRSPFSLRN